MWNDVVHHLATLEESEHANDVSSDNCMRDDVYVVWKHK